MRFLHPRIESFALALVSFLGCGSSATIALKGGQFVEGQIIAGDRESIYVDTGEAETNVPRRRIVDVDHPGNVAATAGIVLAPYGVLNIAVGYSKCNEQGFAFCAGLFAPAVLGFALTSYGFTVWTASRNAMNRDVHGHELARTFFSPTCLRTDGTKVPGLLLVSTF